MFPRHATINPNPGTAPIIKNSGSMPVYSTDKGMTPITKNIHVTDEQGYIYESTYPKRAKGLVKNGRARFISENTICLAHLPETEANTMTENTVSNAEYSIPYILQQIAAIQSDTSHLHETIEKLANMADGDSGEMSSPGNILGQAKAEALGKAIQCRETTNQQLLRLYEKMYDDLVKKSAAAIQ